jgi:transcriptional regulator of acetoin/glycerol metabolism
MKSFIETSHKRCRLRGIKPESIFSTRVLEEQELDKKLEENKELILTAAPFLNHLYDFVRGTNFFAILTDSEGCILEVIGDQEIKAEATRLKMVSGAYMDEEHIGTNAMSIALSEGIPVQVSGKEHYINAYHMWTCSAAPIKDSRGNIIAVIDLTGYSEKVHPHTLGIVVAAANAIEKMLEINNYNSLLEISKKNIETIFNSISSGIITSDMTGNITTINKHVVKMLGYTENEMKKMKIYEIINDWNEVVNKLNIN